ncbi:uncharacterized protein V6R79_003675 [Siganus canaliculatus]
MPSGATEMDDKFCKYEAWSTYANMEPDPGDFNTTTTETQSSENIYQNVMIVSEKPKRTGPTSSGAKETTKCSCGGVVMCLSLLCFLLLAGLTSLAFILTKTNSERLELQNICKNLTQDRDQLQTSYSNLIQERDHWQTSCRNLTRERDQVQDWYNRLAREREVLQTRNSNLTQERDQLQDLYNRLVRAKEVLQTRYSGLTQERRQHEEQVRGLKRKTDQLQKNLKAMTDRCNKGGN